MAKESLADKIKRFNIAVDKNIGKNVSGAKRLKMFLDFTCEYKFHGAYLQDYFQYEFYKKKAVDRRNYVVFGKLLEMMRICNNPEHRYIFDQKPEFDKAFSDFLQRDWINMDNAEFEEFARFVQGKESFFAKDPAGMFGLGVKKISLGEVEDLQALYSDLKEHHMLCEQTLTQCREMAAFNDSSINTLRVVSLVKADGDVKIMGGLLRVGRKGRIADNFHHRGIAAYIDPETGIVSTTGVDKDNVRHIVHPDSGAQIVGFRVPIWDEVVETVKKAALVFPDMHYIGWDVVITDQYKVELVEGNPGADPDAEQITTKEGRWPYYKKYLDEIANA